MFFLYIFYGGVDPSRYPQWQAVADKSKTEFPDINDAEKQMRRLQAEAVKSWENDNPGSKFKIFPLFLLGKE